VGRLWAIVAVSFLLGAGAAGAGPVEDAMKAAMLDVEAGRCQQAVRRFASIDDVLARALLLGGQCRVRHGQFLEALSDLDRAKSLGRLSTQQLGAVELYRGISLYHLERYAEAEVALDHADGSTAEEAQLHLYRGLLALRRNDNQRAAPALELAGRLSPEQTEPVASYYAGLAWLGAAERNKARAAFQRVVELDPDGDWGRQAARMLESTKLFPFYARLQVGFENDDNVLLRATGTDRNTRDGGKDWRGVWSAEAGVQLFSQGAWTGGLQGSYSGSKHDDLSDFDTHYPTASAFLDRRLGPDTLARLRHTFGYAWVDQGSFLHTQSTQASLTHTWEQAGTTEILGDFTWNDFRFRNQDVEDGPCPPGLGNPSCGPPGLDEKHERDRDGYGVGAAIEHRYLVSIADSLDEIIESLVIRGGYRFAWYDSEGTEWEGISNVFSAGFTVELPFDVSLDGSVSYERYDFDNPSTYPDVEVVGQEYSLATNDRTENAVSVIAELEKDLSDSFSVSARYFYYDIDSNRRVYGYHRHIVGAYLNYRFD